MRLSPSVKLLLITFIIFHPSALSNTAEPTSLFPFRLIGKWYQVPPPLEYDDKSKPYELFKLLWTFGHSEADIINRLGKPTERYVSDRDNRHEPNQKLQYITLQYPNLVIEILKTHHPKTFINRLYIKNCDLDSGFKRFLCQPLIKIEEQLGKPSYKEFDELVYVIKIGDVGEVPLRLILKNDHISEIYIRNLID